MARFKQHAEDQLFREYISENLRLIATNQIDAKSGGYFMKSLNEIANPKPAPDGNAIAAEVIGKTGVLFKEQNE